MTTPDIAGLCKELRESANAICDDPPFHDREGDPVPPVVDPDKLFDAADTLERQAAEIERLREGLNGRDDFIVGEGLWPKFCDGLPPRAALLAKGEGT